LFHVSDYQVARPSCGDSEGLDGKEMHILQATSTNNAKAKAKATAATTATTTTNTT
jgi:hypothetical protein